MNKSLNNIVVQFIHESTSSHWSLINYVHNKKTDTLTPSLSICNILTYF